MAWTAGLLALSACGPRPPKPWNADFPLLGTNSSPRAADLNGDGVLDLVIGAGLNEFQASESAVLAVDGASGELLWQAPGIDQVVGSAAFIDISRDGTPDVVIGGRKCQLMALDGRSGRQLWRYEVQGQGYTPAGLARFNFYDAQRIPDQDGDGLDDLLTVNGGNVHAPPRDTASRYPGVLLILSSATGRILAADTMPDGKESYLSPLVFDFGSGLTVLFGTGGETVGGSLYAVPLSALRAGSIQGAERLLSETGHGFVAPPALADLNGDGTPEIIVNSHAARLSAYDFRSRRLLWQTQAVAGAEASNGVAVGRFTGSGTPGCFALYSLGAWPDNAGTVQVLIDGASGAVVLQDSIGCTGFSTPLAADLDGDGLDEALVSVNEYVCGARTPQSAHRLLAYSFREGSPRDLIPPLPGKNVSSTPWLGDLDGDGRLNLVYCVQANTTRLHEFFGLRLAQQPLETPAQPPPAWGAYMGSRGDGVYRP
ncbi:MAG: PQQ-binding-like beta-propeller repeat protein [Bacteroidia bacterium]|nr:PQQ-binding-like beta-propeller repeat protein [Bacteroidia bacterium]